MKKRIYFACSIRGGGDTSSYERIVKAIKHAGCEVISEVFVKDVLLHGGSALTNPEIFERDILMIQAADAIIAEVTNPSLGVGYELAYAESLKKPILCLYNTDSDGQLSAMVRGNSYNHIAQYSKAKAIDQPINEFVSTIQCVGSNHADLPLA